jgi:hypothetical protein
MLKDLGFLPTANVVYFQTPHGLPLNFCAADASDDELGKAVLVADARKKDANWDPNKWPGLAIAASPPAPPADPLPANTPWWQPFAALALAWLLREMAPWLHAKLSSMLTGPAPSDLEAQIAELRRQLEAAKPPASPK